LLNFFLLVFCFVHKNNTGWLRNKLTISYSDKHSHRVYAAKLCYVIGWMDGWLGFNNILSTQVAAML